MASDPEELLRSIERTREELSHTVDTIAGRLDPKRAAKRGVDVVRDSVTSAVHGARTKLHPAPGDGGAPTSAGGGVSAKLSRVGPLVQRVPKPAAGGMAALLALAAIMAVRRRRR